MLKKKKKDHRMAEWWHDSPSERYWCEITDRDDIGADLKCPQANGAGQPYWSYGLINDVMPGDIVFHYSKRTQCIVGASVAGGPVEERDIEWEPPGRSGRARNRKWDDKISVPRPGWWLPLYGHKMSPDPLYRKQLQSAEERTWIAAWSASLGEDASPKTPFYLYGNDREAPEVRALQGYLVKMPLAFVERWHQLDQLVDVLARRQADVENQVAPAPSLAQRSDGFNPKSDSDYIATIRGGTQRRSRSHERLVRKCGEALQRAGADVSTPHPIDLRITGPLTVIVEAKTVGSRSAGFAIRQAIGQLYEYRYFISPRPDHVCVLLDDAPSIEFQTFVEDELGCLLLWITTETLAAGPKTHTLFAAAGLRI